MWSTEVDRRALPIDGHATRVGSDEAIEVARLELVRVACEGLEVADAEEGQPGAKTSRKDSARERRVAAGAAAADGDAVAGSTRPRSTSQRTAEGSRRRR